MSSTPGNVLFCLVPSVTVFGGSLPCIDEWTCQRVTSARNLHGYQFPKDIWESVSCAARLGLDYTITEAVTGVSKRRMQKVVPEEEHGATAQIWDCGRRTCPRILESEHLEVSNYSIPIDMYPNNMVTPFSVSESPRITQPVATPQRIEG